MVRLIVSWLVGWLVLCCSCDWGEGGGLRPDFVVACKFAAKVRHKIWCQEQVMCATERKIPHFAHRKSLLHSDTRTRTAQTNRGL